MTQWVESRQLKAWLHDGQEIALFDVREQGQFGESHLFYAVPLPYSRLEIDIGCLAPRKDVRLVVYDGDGEGVAGRPLAEFHKMSIPTATCCPNGELAYRVRQLVPSDKTRIVINCAGRTRSIIGAQTLINLGLPNPVYALENGTQGWFLADHPLEHGKTQAYGPPADLADLALMKEAANKLAARFNVRVVSDYEVQAWAADATRSLFVCDVRTPEEFRQGSLLGAQSTPGGQLLQAVDQYVGVRNARIVLVDSDGIRALTVASWLVQMGHDASVLAAGYAVAMTPDSPPDKECMDYLFFVHDRHDGNKAAARQYLAWETNLVSQLDAQEIASFRLPPPNLK